MIDAFPPLSDASRRTLLMSAACLPLIGCSTFAVTKNQQYEPRVRRKAIAPFSAATADGTVPDGWQPFVLRPDKRLTEYGAVSMGNRTVLRAFANRASTAMICPVDISPAEAPWLTWQWKVDKLVEGADVSNDNLDDSPARIFVAFDGNVNGLQPADIAFFDFVKFFTGKDLPYASLFYVWDNKLPLETVVVYPRSSRIKYIVVESGPAQLGQWVTYRRNVVDDYIRAFDEQPNSIISVGVLCDTDDLGQQAEAYFGDIALQDHQKPSIAAEISNLLDN